MHRGLCERGSSGGSHVRRMCMYMCMGRVEARTSDACACAWVEWRLARQTPCPGHAHAHAEGAASAEGVTRGCTCTCAHACTCRMHMAEGTTAGAHLKLGEGRVRRDS